MLSSVSMVRYAVPLLRRPRQLIDANSQGPESLMDSYRALPDIPQPGPVVHHPRAVCGPCGEVPRVVADTRRCQAAMGSEDRRWLPGGGSA